MVQMCVCVCKCVCVQMCMCMCVSVCVCERERERGEQIGDKDSEVDSFLFVLTCLHTLNPSFQLEHAYFSFFSCMVHCTILCSSLHIQK